MKKLLFWLALIVGTVALIGSCAKKDEDAAATAAVPAEGSGSTASGTVSGIDGLTGTFEMSYRGQEPSGGCVDNSTAVATFVALNVVPSDTLAWKQKIIITSSTTYTKSLLYYSDASCATLTGYMNNGYKTFLVGDSLSGLSAGSNPAKPTTAKKVSYNEDFTALKSNTDTTTSFFNTLMGASGLAALGFTQGTELKITNDGDAEVNIWEIGTMSGSSKTYLYTGNSAASTYPSAWTSNDGVWWQE